MTYNKFTLENLAQWTLDGNISAWATTLVLDWQGDLFPTTFPFICKIEQFTATNVTKREIVKCTGRTWNTLTIVRSFESCPADYTATTLTTTAFAFLDGDVVSLIESKATIKDIQDEVTRLENDKLNITAFNTSLRTWLTADRILFVNSSWDESEIVLWDSWKYLMSNWATADPTFETAVVADATTTTKWVVEKATWAETVSWTADKFPDASDIKDTYLMVANSISLTRDSTATWAVINYAHWLGKIPKFITFTMPSISNSTNASSYWTYVTATNANLSVYVPYASNNTAITTASCISYWAGDWNWQFWAVTALDATNITITWTKSWSPTWTLNVLVNCIA